MNHLTYGGGNVSRADVERALDLLVEIEPDPESEIDYELAIRPYKEQIETANKIIKQFGEQIEPKTLEYMQEVFYSFTNSEKYRASNLSISVVRSALQYGWKNIGPWQS